jgi:hypothetical protein
MTKSTPTLTQSGLLAVLLEHQRRKVIELARRRAHREQVRAAFGVSSPGCWRALTVPPLIDYSAEALGEPFRGALESFTKSIAMSHQIHTYTEFRQQIHDDLRAQHPEWVQPNGQSPMCDSYEARLMELLDTFTQRGSNESVGAIHPALQQGLN